MSTITSTETDVDTLRVKPSAGTQFRKINARQQAAAGRRVTFTQTLASLVDAYRQVHESWPGIGSPDDSGDSE